MVRFRPEDILLKEELDRGDELIAVYEACLKMCTEDPVGGPSALEELVAAAMAADAWMLVRETSGTSVELERALASESLSEQRRNVFRLADDRFRLRAQVLASVRQNLEFLREVRFAGKSFIPGRQDLAAERRKLVAFPGGQE